MMGIAIATYNRAASLGELLDAVRRDVGDCPLVVCNDGSADDTIEQCLKRDVSVVGKVNRGIAWNKNRGLFWLSERTTATSFLLLEDDMVITNPSWYRDWQMAIEEWGHVTWADERLLGQRPGRHIAGSGVPEDPYVLHLLTGQAMGFTREAIVRGGYFNPQFRGYGFEHIDLTRRLNSLGYGTKKVLDAESGIEMEGCINISGGMTLLELPTASDRSSTEDNRKVYDKIRQNRFATRGMITMPWSDETERLTFMDEIDQVSAECSAPKLRRSSVASESATLDGLK